MGKNIERQDFSNGYLGINQATIKDTLTQEGKLESRKVFNLGQQISAILTNLHEVFIQVKPPKKLTGSEIKKVYEEKLKKLGSYTKELSRIATRDETSTHYAKKIKSYLKEIKEVNKIFGEDTATKGLVEKNNIKIQSIETTLDEIIQTPSPSKKVELSPAPAEQKLSTEQMMEKAGRQFANAEPKIQQEILKEIEDQLNMYEKSGKIVLGGPARIYSSLEEQKNHEVIEEGLKAFFNRKDLHIKNVIWKGGSVLAHTRLKSQIMDFAENYFKDVKDEEMKETTMNIIRGIVYKREFYTDPENFISKIKENTSVTEPEKRAISFFKELQF